MVIEITSTGGFNTGRMYTAKGQRIFWAQHDNGWLFFRDLDRMIEGWIERSGTLADAGWPVVPSWLMGKYDRHEFEYYMPGQSERNPSTPADMEFGAALNI